MINSNHINKNTINYFEAALKFYRNYWSDFRRDKMTGKVPYRNSLNHFIRLSPDFPVENPPSAENNEEIF